MLGAWYLQNFSGQGIDLIDVTHFTTGLLFCQIFSEEVKKRMTAHKFSIGHPVWAKLKGYSHWPGKVSPRYYTYYILGRTL